MKKRGGRKASRYDSDSDDDVPSFADAAAVEVAPPTSAKAKKAAGKKGGKKNRFDDSDDDDERKQEDLLGEDEYDDVSMPTDDNINVHNFSIHMGGKTLFKDSNLNLSHGRRYGLVGYNGTGKSTLLNHIVARDGQFRVPRHIDIHIVQQEAPANDVSALQTVINSDEMRTRLLAERDRLLAIDEPTMEETERLNKVYERLIFIEADSALPRASAILSGLQFDENMKQMATREFSGGWRMRIALACALFRKPRLLLLDEPTNHLDLHAVIWLESYLQNWRNTLVVVSHDRDFLTSVCSDILHIWQQKLFHYRGDYSNFERQFNLKLDQDRDAYEKQQKRIKALKRSGKLTMDLSKSKTTDSKARRAERTKVLSTRKDRGGSKKSHDDGDDNQEEQLLQPVDEYFVRLGFTPAPELANQVLLKVDGVSFGYPGRRTLFRGVSFGMDTSSRIAIVGANGTGKSTLLKLITRDLIPDEGEVQHNPKLRIAVYSQHSVDQLDLNKSAVQHLMDKFNVPYQDARKYLGTIGLPGNVHEHRMRTLSGGQKSRVCMVEIQLTQAHILLLDEPTNHLDLETVDALVRALNEFEGGVVVVTHNVSLIEQVCNEIWVCKDDCTVSPYKGDFQDYVDELLDEMEAKEYLVRQH
ncbi:hypothetical protein H696_06031 [Fonticula alba]|uniref:ABC transporter domain-containing protein n=1 Tax=Fonticula alba TaxID=691883 RepID=A0A058Z1Z6_FONAL|nr:hypothetical protein H696_06031 [Fonticula alba]KCV67512.1 hypothetical protein H696_06031 [Fonticula alba]|eukprot:XP_009498073.1 hypothetical protein H696_06031 [Fonticula alba]